MGKTALLRHCIAEAPSTNGIVVYAEASAQEPPHRRSSAAWNVLRDERVAAEETEERL